MAKMTIGKGPFPDRGALNSSPAVPVGVFDIKKGEVPSERLAKFALGVLFRERFHAFHR